MRVSTCAIYTLLALPLAAGAADEPLRFHLRSLDLDTPIDGAKSIILRGTIHGDEGTANLGLDPNQCTLNEFGDRTICTLLGFPQRRVILRHSHQGDPLKDGRRLFRIEGHDSKDSLSLVVPRDPHGAYRLIHQSGETRTVVALERQSLGDAEPQDGPREEPEERSCSPLPISVDDTVARAKIGKKKKGFHVVLTGRKPHSNTTIEFDAVTYIRQPEYWEINVRECSKGPIRLPAIADFEVVHDLSSHVGTRGIVLRFADGKSLKLDVPARPNARE